MIFYNNLGSTKVMRNADQVFDPNDEPPETILKYKVRPIFYLY